MHARAYTDENGLAVLFIGNIRLLLTVRARICKKRKSRLVKLDEFLDAIQCLAAQI